MAAIIESTEENGVEGASRPAADRAGVICEAAARIAEHMDARYPVTFSRRVLVACCQHVPSDPDAGGEKRRYYIGCI